MISANRLYIPVYAATLLLSAFLLFLVQPLFGKMLLPMLGGSPAVWNTAMLFFQVFLLAGYGYAHGTSRFMRIRAQALLHLALLTLFLFVLPIAIPANWTPPTETDPTLWQLGLMFVVVGGPFFILSGSAPMLQHWFAHTKHKDSHNPYFLYAASNLGSMTALLAYPFFVEPALTISGQSLAWAWGYGLLILCILAAVLLVWRHVQPEHHMLKTKIPEDDIITWKRRGLWLILAFVPSSLMLGVTTYITTDIASAPLLWMPPLLLYVSTFIIAFAKKPFPSHRATLKIQGYLFILLLAVQISLFPLDKMFPFFSVFLHLLVFFFTALMCHQELASSRPPVRHLTQFYLIMSLGGALGGFFNAIIAPHAFVIPLEYGLILGLSAFMRFSSREECSLKMSLQQLQQKTKTGAPSFLKSSGVLFIFVILITSLITPYLFHLPQALLLSAIIPILALPLLMRRRWVFGFCTLAILLLHVPGNNLTNQLTDALHYQGRNFFGVIRVGDDTKKGIRMLFHGTTIHGTQAIAPEYKMERLSYYSTHSPLKEAFEIADTMSMPQMIGTIGLGVGESACYRKKGRRFEFFEIDPAVARIAENPDFFTYLSDCGSPYEIILGDGRLKIMEKPDQYYDIIFLDAFSSDNIPIHIITYEAFAGYQRKLKENGFIVIHISNRYMNLKPVLAAAAQALDMMLFSKYTEGGKLENSGLPYNPSEYAILTRNPAHILALKEKKWNMPQPSPDIPLWTDQYSDIISVFKIFQHAPHKEKTH